MYVTTTRFYSNLIEVYFLGAQLRARKMRSTKHKTNLHKTKKEEKK